MRPTYPIAGQATRLFCLLLCYALTFSLFVAISRGYSSAASSAKQAARVIAPAFSGKGGTPGKFNVEPPQPTKGIVENLPNLSEMRKRESDKPKIRKPVIEGVCPSGICYGAKMLQSGSVNDPDFSTARRRPENETGTSGVDLGSRNFNWSLPIVNLPGRAGLDLNLTVYYNSLVWTKQGTNTRFGLNRGFPGLNGVDRAAGFELHLPYLQQRYQNQDYGLYAYMLVMPSGGRIEFRRVGTSNIYESADSSYAQLTDNGTAGATVRMRDGTLYTFGWNEITTTQWGQQSVKSRRCTQIKDRNGNFITAAYNTNGALISITDTLGRVINFNYDPTMNVLTSITQTRNGTTYTWATFSYSTVWFSVNFAPPDSGNNSNGAGAQVLTQINLPDGSYYGFNYNTYAQVYRITHYAPDGHARSYINYNLPLDASVQQSDCPRFTEQRVWAENWNNNQEVVTNYSVASDGSWSQVTLPDSTPSNPNDNVVHREYFATTGWQKGLPTRTETFIAGAPSTLLKWTTTTWTQDDETLTYPKNPRVIESNVYDSDNNRKRTTINYDLYASYGLPHYIDEYAGDGVTLLRRTYIDYNLNQAYLDRRILGLVSSEHVSDGSGWVLKLVYEYDAGGDQMAATPAQATQHDANYGASFTVGRGNLTAVSRYDVTDVSNESKKTVTRTGYNSTGSIVFTKDGLNHQTTLAYADSFSDGVNRNTFAYQTAVTDADGYTSTVQYNYDHGAVTQRQTPLANSATNQPGPTEAFSYDSVGRLERVDSSPDGAYTRWVYPSSQTYLRTITKVNAASPDEFSSEEHFDGMGRLRLITTQLPNSVGGNRVSKMEYDAMGRVVKQSNPTETDGNWNPTGDDAAGMQWTQQAYDWNGRPTLTTNPDGTTRELTYGGCGCAGGQVVTTRDERGRRKKMTTDVIGRLKKVEELNWDQSVYSTTNYTYNARNQITGINQMGQTRTFEYDGHGRLWRRTTPEQGLTTYAYNADDTVQAVTDARGATSTFGYNNRHLMTGVSYNQPSGVAATANISYDYDAVGNRTSMTDGLGSATYHYDQLSRIDWEERAFSGVGTYRLSYAYNLAGGLTSVTGPSQFGSINVGYTYDKMGRITGVTGGGYAGVSSYINNLSYRAFGGVKQINYGNTRQLSVQYDNRLRLTRWDVGGVLGSQYQYLWEDTNRPTFASSLYDSTLDRLYIYDHVGRLHIGRTGSEARAGYGQAWNGLYDGPYSTGLFYDVWGNLTSKEGWGGVNPAYTATYTNNRRNGFSYDAAGNLTNDGQQAYTYDAAGQQVYASGTGLTQNYDGDGVRGKKVESGATTYYLRSSVLGKQVVTEINGNGTFKRGYVYMGGQMLALQEGGQVSWAHQDPVTKSQRMTNSSGAVVSTVELDPWGGETARSSNSQMQPHRYTSYERDNNGGDDAMMRRYESRWQRFAQPDPYEGSYDLTNPQSFNRYSYVQNDPVNFVDPTGLSSCFLMYSYTEWVDSRGRVVATTNHRSSIICFGSGGGSTSGQTRRGQQMTPPRVRNATPAQQSRFDEVFNELWKRLHENDGNNPCAQFFGGIKKAEKALKDLKFSVGPTSHPKATAEISRNNVTLNPNNGFFGTSGFQQIQVGLGYPPDQRGLFVDLDDVQAGAFGILHEMGHKTGALRDDGHDPFGFLSVMNSGEVRKACFGEAGTYEAPLKP